MRRLFKFLVTITAIFILLMFCSLSLRGYIEKKVTDEYNDIKHTEWVKTAREVRLASDSLRIGNVTNLTCDEIR